MTAPVSDTASSKPLSFLHHDDTSLEDLYDASDGLIHLAKHAGEIGRASCRERV